MITRAIAIVLLLSAYLTHAEGRNIYGNCLSKTRSTYILPDTPLSILNPWLANDSDYQALVNQGCRKDRDLGSVCHDKPAIGSGLTQLSAKNFLGLTDRGPNQDCEDLSADPITYPDAVGKTGKGFPVHRFEPTITRFIVELPNSTLTVVKPVPLVGDDSQPISGLPNSDRDETPYAAGCVGDPLPYDPSGLDTEDIAIIPGTKYVAIVDEYSPSVLIANHRTGRIVARHVPASVAPVLDLARYTVVGDIPDVFANRRKNRGFEAVVVDENGSYLIAILQSPMLGEEENKTANNTIIRCAYFDMTISDDGTPSLKYSRSFIIEASSPAAYDDTTNDPKDIKYSGAQHFSEGKFVALERAKGQVKLFLVDFSSATNVDQTKYADNLRLEMDTNGVYKASQMGVIPADKTLIWDSAPGIGGSADFMGRSKQEGFVIDRKRKNIVWMIDDNGFGLAGNGNVEMRKIALGRAPEGATVCKLPKHPDAPVINIEPSKKIKLVNSQTFRISNEPGAGAAENMDVDDIMMIMRAYVANDDSGNLDMYDVSTSPVTPMKSYAPGAPFKPTSASVCRTRDMIAVSLADDEDEAGPGRIDILTKDLGVIRRIKKAECILPDHVRWSDDCGFLVAACEGVGADVPGGVLVADFMGPAGASYRGTTVANFKAYDRIANSLKENGVRLVESDVRSVDLEPEYVTINGRHAFITIQEANCIAVVDLYEGKITELKPIGFIDRNKNGFGLDASDKDKVINIRNYPFLLGMPQPDTIANYVAGDAKTYLVFANEGAAKDDAEEVRAKDITDVEELNRNTHPRLRELIEKKKLLGRLKISSIMGYNNATNFQEKIYHFGSRSFSIMSLDGSVVFDSGEWFARIQEKHFPTIFNANHFDDDDLSASQAALFDKRSDDKGMEPESLALLNMDGVTYAFIGFERSSIIVVFDITIPTAPVFVEAVQNHPFNDPIDEVFSAGKQGDLDPEALFVSAELKKLFVSGSVSNTLSTYEMPRR